ncbi:MAG: hypothetical protein NTX53_19685 [candidate division WOR-3 bacterium]|nr:hypothetical protein [candidate division WOR-3 bacterium]
MELTFVAQARQHIVWQAPHVSQTVQVVSQCEQGQNRPGGRKSAYGTGLLDPTRMRFQPVLPSVPPLHDYMAPGARFVPLRAIPLASQKMEDEVG